MDIKERLSQELSKLKDETDKIKLLNQVLSFLSSWHEQMLTELSQGGILSEKTAPLRKSEVIQRLTGVYELLNEDLKLAMKLERNRLLEAEIDSLKRENEELVRKFELAHKQIDKATAEAEKAKKAAINNTRKKLESTRDKLCAIAETSQNLRDLLPASNQTDSVHNSIMNILANIELVTEEMERLELWPATSPKPRTDRPKEEVKSTENPTLPFGEPEPEDEPEEKKELPSELEEVQGEVQELVAEPETAVESKGDDEPETSSASAGEQGDKSQNKNEVND